MPKDRRKKKPNLRLKDAMPELAWRLICIDKLAMEIQGPPRDGIMMFTKEMFDIIKDMGFDYHGYKKADCPYRRKL